MEKSNLVPCKMCNKDFYYRQNISGNARQLCPTCRLIVDNLDLEKLEDDTIKEGNRFLIGAPGRKDEYDVTEILLDGNFPEFNSDADKFVCVMELATFIKRNGFNGCERNVMLFKKHLDSKVHSVLLELELGMLHHEHLVGWCYKNEGSY